MPTSLPQSDAGALVVPVAGASLRLSPKPWAWAEANREAIERDWARRTAQNPSLFNGRFFVLVDYTLDGGHLTGTCVETDYASYLHWRGLDFPDRAWNAFAMPALHAPDGRLLVARMAGWTANAGQWYPPAGSLEPPDLRTDGTFDLVGNMSRELDEEIGWVPSFDAHPDWTLVITRGRMALFRTVVLNEPAERMEARIRAHIAQDSAPELDDVRFVTARDLQDLTARPFLHAYLDAYEARHR